MMWGIDHSIVSLQALRRRCHLIGGSRSHSISADFKTAGGPWGGKWQTKTIVATIGLFFPNKPVLEILYAA
jgi:hypothetical protein